MLGPTGHELERSPSTRAPTGNALSLGPLVLGSVQGLLRRPGMPPSLSLPREEVAVPGRCLERGQGPRILGPLSVDDNIALFTLACAMML